MENIESVGAGIDLDALDNTYGDSMPFIQSIEHDETCINLLYIGRLEPRRNTPYIFDVAKELEHRGVDGQLIIVGDGDESYLLHCA